MVNCFEQAKRVVVKVGTSTLTYDTGLINIRHLEKLVKTLSDLKNSGKDVILVSSGAIGVGVGKLGLKERPQDTPSKQAAASVGQCELMYLYDKLFAEYNHTISQVLITRDSIDDPVRKQHVVNTFERLMDYGAIPIVNENDTVSVEEIEFGDNDTLSAIVATIAQADVLVVMTDVDGLYDADPRTCENAKLIRQVAQVDDDLKAKASGAGTRRGTGGMITKLNAAQFAMEHGIDMAIVNGKDPYILYRLFEGQQVGTHFIRKG